MPENSAPIRKKVKIRFLTAEKVPKVVKRKRLKWGSVSSKKAQIAIKIISAGKSQFAK